MQKLPLPITGDEDLADLVDRSLRAAAEPLRDYVRKDPDLEHRYAGTWQHAVRNNLFKWSLDARESRSIRDHDLDPHILIKWVLTTWNLPDAWPCLHDAGISKEHIELIFKLRNGHAHNRYVSSVEPFEPGDVSSGLGALRAVMAAIGDKAAAQYVQSAYEVADRRAKRLTKRKRWKDLRDDEPSGTPHTVGLHWTEPDPQTRKPAAWWLVHLDHSGQLKSAPVPQSTTDVRDYLAKFVENDQPVLLGCAFCFSVPRWLGERCASQNNDPLPECVWAVVEEAASGAANAKDLVRSINEALGLEDGPFWQGDTNDPDPNEAAGRASLRRTEVRVQKATEAKPSSVFRVGGDASVGGLALWGMPMLHWLRSQGFSIWPFDPPGKRTVVEIFPRSLWSATQFDSAVPSLPGDRTRFLDGHPYGDGGGTRETLLKERRAFDALMTAWALRNYGGNISRYVLGSSESAVEGEIWLPTPNGARPAA